MGALVSKLRGGGAADDQGKEDKKAIVRCGHSFGQCPGNQTFVQVMNNYRGDFQAAPHKSEEREKIVGICIDFFTFVDGNSGELWTAKAAREKIKKALGDSRRPTRRTAVVAAAMTNREPSASSSEESDSESSESEESSSDEDDSSSGDSSSSSSSEEDEDDSSYEDSDQKDRPLSQNKLVVRCGKAFCRCKLPGNLAYMEELQLYRNAYAKTAPHSMERERIIRHFQSRYIFVQGTTNRRLLDEQVLEKLRLSLGNRFLKRERSPTNKGRNSCPSKRRAVDTPQLEN